MHRSLSGKKVLITREENQAKTFASQVEHAGGESIIVPLLTIQYKNDPSNQRVWDQLSHYRWIFFTSYNGVHGFFHYLHQLGLEFPSGISIGIVGTKTEAALHDYGYESDFVPSIFDAETMAKEFMLQYYSEQPVLLIRGNLSRDVIPDEFQLNNIVYDSLEVYETTYRDHSKESLQNTVEDVDYITFTSPSTVIAFMDLVDEVPACEYICIGTTTEAKAKALHIPNLHIPNEFTTDAMIDIMIGLASREDEDEYDR